MTFTLDDPSRRAALRRLLTALDAAGYDYPAPAARALADPGAVADRTPPEDLLTLSDAELAAHTREVAVDTWLRSGADSYGSAVLIVQAQLAGAAAALLAEHAEELLDQMRPGFDDAASAVHAAVRAGITATTTAGEAIRLGGQVAEMWNGLDGHTRVLERVGTIRTALSEACGVPPGYTTGPFSSSQPTYRHGLSFGVSLARWHTGANAREARGRWLSVCTTPEPPRLLSVAETEAADAAEVAAEHRRNAALPPADSTPPLDEVEELPRYSPAF